MKLYIVIVGFFSLSLSHASALPQSSAELASIHWLRDVVQDLSFKNRHLQGQCYAYRIGNHNLRQQLDVQMQANIALDRANMHYQSDNCQLAIQRNDLFEKSKLLEDANRSQQAIILMLRAHIEQQQVRIPQSHNEENAELSHKY